MNIKGEAGDLFTVGVQRNKLPEQTQSKRFCSGVRGDGPSQLRTAACSD